MAKYIDAGLLIRKIKGQIRLEKLNFAALGGGGQTFCTNTLEWVLKQIDSQLDEPSKDLDVTDFSKPLDTVVARAIADTLLEEAATTFATDTLPLGEGTYVDGGAYRGFIAGAKWQKKQDTADMLKSDFTVFNKCYEQGKEDMKEQMMKEAVELGTVDIYWEQDGDRAFPTFDPPAENLLLPDIISQRFKDGEKVKVIIVKEEDEE